MQPLTRSSLRRTLIVSALVVAALASAVMLVVFSIAVAQREEIDRDASAFIAEQRIADHIVALTSRQQLEAVQFIERPDPSRLARFRALGDLAYAEMRRYLFHELSAPARLQVERMKEAHQGFEVVAQRVFEDARRGRIAEARTRMTALDATTAALDSAVRGFLEVRLEQRADLQRRHEQFTERVRAGLVATSLLLFAAGLLLALHLRRRVLTPLEQLADVAERIRLGDADARLPAQRYAELDAVARAFNGMADSVQSSRQTTEMQNEELRQSLDELQSTQDELVQHEKLSAMGQMLAGLAHELNNPLAGMLGMAELLRSELADSPDAQVRQLGLDLATPLEREALRARELVRSLLSFARKPSGVPQSVALASTIHTAAGLRAHAYVQAGLALHVDVPEAIHVSADPQKLQLVVVNLLNNALDAMRSAGGKNLTIRAALEPDDIVRVDFDDDGPGFRDARAVFEPFYTTKGPEEGTGLGLTLVQKFVNEFGGTVSATNRPGGGARVSLLLRRAAPVSQPATAESAALALPASATADRDAAGFTAPEQPRPRVLVVDDEPSLREVQRRLLTLEGIDVVLAASAEEAVEVLKREVVDLVISDLRMPGTMDGRDLLATLAQQHPRLAAGALLVTGDISGTAMMFPVPADRVISKPFRRVDYVARVRRALAETAAFRRS